MAPVGVPLTTVVALVPKVATLIPSADPESELQRRSPDRRLALRLPKEQLSLVAAAEEIRILGLYVSCDCHYYNIIFD